MCLVKLGAALRISSDFSQRSHSRARTNEHTQKIHFFPFIRLAESCIAYIKVLCTHTKSRTEWKFSISCQPFFALFFFVRSRSGRAELMLSRLRASHRQRSDRFSKAIFLLLRCVCVCVFPSTRSVSLWSACALCRAACAGARQRSAYVVRCVCVRVYWVRERAHVCACGRVNVCIG